MRTVESPKFSRSVKKVNPVAAFDLTENEFQVAKAMFDLTPDGKLNNPTRKDIVKAVSEGRSYVGSGFYAKESVIYHKLENAETSPLNPRFNEFMNWLLSLPLYKDLTLEQILDIRRNIYRRQYENLTFEQMIKLRREERAVKENILQCDVIPEKPHPVSWSESVRDREVFLWETNRRPQTEKLNPSSDCVLNPAEIYLLTFLFSCKVNEYKLRAAGIKLEECQINILKKQINDRLKPEYEKKLKNKQCESVISQKNLDGLRKKIKVLLTDPARFLNNNQEYKLLFDHIPNPSNIINKNNLEEFFEQLIPLNEYLLRDFVYCRSRDRGTKKGKYKYPAAKTV